MISSSVHNSNSLVNAPSSASVSGVSNLSNSGIVNSSSPSSYSPFLYNPSRGHPNFNPTKPVVNVFRSESVSRSKAKSEKSSKNRKKQLNVSKDDKHSYSHLQYDYPYHQYGYYPEDDPSLGDDDGGLNSQKQFSSSRFYRNNMLIAEVFSDKIMPDVRSVVTNNRLEVLRRQADSLILHQERSLNELTTMEQNFSEKKRRILEASAEFSRQLEQFSKPAADSDTYQKMFEKALEQLKMQNEHQTSLEKDKPATNSTIDSSTPQPQCNQLCSSVTLVEYSEPTSESDATPVTSFSTVTSNVSPVYHKIGQFNSDNQTTSFNPSTTTTSYNVNNSSNSVYSRSSMNSHQHPNSGHGSNYHSVTPSGHTMYHSSYSQMPHHHSAGPVPANGSEYPNYNPMPNKMPPTSSYPHHPQQPQHHMPPQHHHVEMTFNLRNALSGPTVGGTSMSVPGSSGQHPHPHSHYPPNIASYPSHAPPPQHGNPNMHASIANMPYHARRPMLNMSSSNYTASSMYGPHNSTQNIHPQHPQQLQQPHPHQRFSMRPNQFDPRHQTAPKRHPPPPSISPASNISNKAPSTPNVNSKKKKAGKAFNNGNSSPIHKNCRAKSGNAKKSSNENSKKNDSKMSEGKGANLLEDDDDKKSDITEVDTDTETTIMSPSTGSGVPLDDDDERTMEESSMENSVFVNMPKQNSKKSSKAIESKSNNTAKKRKGKSTADKSKSCSLLSKARHKDTDRQKNEKVSGGNFDDEDEDDEEVEDANEDLDDDYVDDDLDDDDDEEDDDDDDDDDSDVDDDSDDDSKNRRRGKRSASSIGSTANSKKGSYGASATRSTRSLRHRKS